VAKDVTIMMTMTVKYITNTAMFVRLCNIIFSHSIAYKSLFHV